MFNTLKILKTMKIKKLFAIAALLMGSTSAFALTQEYTYEGLIYTLDDGTLTATVKKVSDDATYKAKTTWILPEKFKALEGNGAGATFKDKEFTVVGIGESAFEGNTNITSVTFATPAKATGTIGAKAFKGCTALTSFAIGDEITEIGAEAFSGCTAMTELTFGKKVATFGDEIIKGTAITSLDLSVVETAAASIVLGSTNNNVFESTTLEEIIFASFKADGSVDKTFNATTLPAKAFTNCVKLASVVLPAGLTSLPNDIFKYTKIATLDLSYLSDLGAVGQIFGASYATLTTVKLPTTLNATLAFTGTFANCTGLTSLTIPAGWAPAASRASKVFIAGSLVGSGVTTVTFNPTLTAGAWAGADEIFDVAAFAAAATPRTIKFSTTSEYVAIATTAPNKTEYDYSTFTVKEITLNGNYALLCQTNAYRVPIENGVVYSLYEDAVGDGDGTIYMVPFKVENASYQVPAATPVLVKAKQKNDNGKLEIQVRANDVAGGDMVGSALLRSPDAITLIADLGITPGKYCNVAAIKDGVFGIGSPSESYLNNKTYYIESKKQYGAAGARIVWLDEDDATAIKTIKAKAGNNGAIYNLAGQKVNASYKGVVIKDGKKYIQK